jgi:hypothetical protein
VSVNSASMSGAGFSVTGLTTPQSLAPGQKSSFTVTFAPSSAGAVSGNVNLANSSATSPAVVGLSGTGANPLPHSANLSWTPPSSAVTGYNVYRATQSGGPYTRMNSALLLATAYADSSVHSGLTYYYVTTSVNASNTESAYSNQATAVIPVP